MSDSETVTVLVMAGPSAGHGGDIAERNCGACPVLPGPAVSRQRRGQALVLYAARAAVRTGPAVCVRRSAAAPNARSRLPRHRPGRVRAPRGTQVGVHPRGQAGLVVVEEDDAVGAPGLVGLGVEGQFGEWAGACDYW